MKEKKEQIKKVNNKKIVIYILLIFIAIYLGYTVYLLVKQPTDIFMVENGSVSLEETDLGYIIRDEEVVKGNNYANGMEQIKSEGEKTAKGESIYRYYSKNEDSLTKQIAELDSQIQEVLANQKSEFTSDVKLIENQLDEKIEQLNNITDVSKLSECKKEIANLIIKKAKIVGELSPSGAYLKQLYNKRTSLENELNSGAEYIKAPRSGIVSYRVDGLEDVLKPENFSTLNKEYLEKLNLKTGKIVATSNECGKIINNFECYIATISTSAKSKEAKVGDTVKIRLPNNSIIDAQIEYLSQEDENNTLLIFKVKNKIDELINYRKISFDLIWWNYSGLKVPNKAIVEENGFHYVVRNRAGYLDKILVNVQEQNDKYSIIKNYKTTELQKLGFSAEDIKAYKTISLYDEIIINPDLSKTQ